MYDKTIAVKKEANYLNTASKLCLKFDAKSIYVFAISIHRAQEYALTIRHQTCMPEVKCQLSHIQTVWNVNGINAVIIDFRPIYFAFYDVERGNKLLLYEYLLF